jgi:DNA repair protein RecO (recombination protein O)
MDWSEEGIVLAARRHGESAAIVTLLTRAHGRHAGLVRGGGSRRARGLYEPGNRVQATWRARLAEHLGNLTCEPLASPAAAVLDDPLRLAALAAAAALAESALPEREPHPRAYDGFGRLMESLCGEAEPEWLAAYVRWEIDLLAELGFGLDLARCAVTGEDTDLAWVSPKSGRAVSRQAGARWRERLLDLPAFLTLGGDCSRSGALAGLKLAGHFLERHVFAQRPGSGGIPAARERFVARLRRNGSAHV